MTRALALAILTGMAAMPLRAGDSAYWGGTGCQLVPVTGETWVAEMRCINILTGYEPWTEAMVTAGGLDVHLSVLHGPGDVPDQFTVTPPDGFIAQPSQFDLNEDQSGVALIYPWVGM